MSLLSFLEGRQGLGFRDSGGLLTNLDLFHAVSLSAGAGSE